MDQAAENRHPLSTLSAAAAAAGLRIWEPSWRSPWFWECGPFVLIDVCTNVIVAKQLDESELAAEIHARLPGGRSPGG